MKYKSRTEIVSMILEAANGCAIKTRIMYAFLSYAQLKDIFPYLLKIICSNFEGHKSTKLQKKDLTS
jgi:predicted transcriptional regulator